jgi:pimeloyl-ACP methyl ester carboxylesterase
MPRTYAEVFAKGIAGPTTTRIIAGAGHLAELDKPAEVAREVLGFLEAG